MIAHVHDNVNFLTVRRGLMSWLVTVDHKRIGLMYLASILAFFIVGGSYAFMFRLELWSPLPNFIKPETYNHLFTMHGVIMVFLVVVPGIPSALGNFRHHY